MKYTLELIEEYEKYAKTRCSVCHERVKDTDLGVFYHDTPADEPDEGFNVCPLCKKETELYEESLEQYIEAEGYDAKDCTEGGEDAID